MHTRKHTGGPRRWDRKKIALVAALAMLLALAIGGTIAFLTDSEPPVVNKFLPVQVSCAVAETVENNVKTEVKIQNTSDIDAYIRVAMVDNYVKTSNDHICSEHDVTSSYIVNGADWVKGADGFYYYTKPVASGEYTAKLFGGNIPLTENAGCCVEKLEFVATAIQAAGVGSDNKAPVVSAWKTGVSAVSATDGTGVLTIKQ